MQHAVYNIPNDFVWSSCSFPPHADPVFPTEICLHCPSMPPNSSTNNMPVHADHREALGVVGTAALPVNAHRTCCMGCVELGRCKAVVGMGCPACARLGPRAPGATHIRPRCGACCAATTQRHRHPQQLTSLHATQHMLLLAPTPMCCLLIVPMVCQRCMGCSG